MNELTTLESNRLTELERVIDAGLKTSWEVINALAEINRDRLYRAQYPNFEAYCDEEWGFSRQHAYRLIEAAGVVACLPSGDRMPNERQARELAPLPPEDRAAVWATANAEGNPTAERVARAREEYLTAQALAALPAEEQLRVIREQEERAIEGNRHMERADVVKSIIRRLKTLERLTLGLGAEKAVDYLHQFRSAVESLIEAGS